MEKHDEYFLASYFREVLGLKAKVNQNVYLKGVDSDFYSYVKVDVILGDNEIAIEHKEWRDLTDIQRGIGQSLMNLLSFKESWLSVPNKALELLKPLLEKLKIKSFKVLDWENMELYEFKDGKIISHRL